MFVSSQNISFSYEKEHEVLKNVSFSVEKGETLAIVGASGSGKSTILRIIAGILPNKSENLLKGHIYIDDNSSSEYLKKGKLSFMFQEPTLFPNLNVKENIEIPLRVKRQSNPDKINYLIDIVGLKSFEGFLPNNLSGGMKTRVALARSFITNPELLLLDEPFSSLDVAWRDALYSELIQLRNDNNTTVILVTHDISEALRLSNKVLCLSFDGKILIEQTSNINGNLHKLIEEKIIEDHRLRKINEKKNIISVV